VPEGGSKHLWTKRVRDTVSLRCWDLPHVGHPLVDELGGIVALCPVCPILHELRGDIVCRDGPQARGASRPVSRPVTSLGHQVRRRVF